MMGFLTGRFAPHALVGLGVVVVGLSVALWVSNANASRYEAERDAARNEVTGLVESAKSKDKLITDLQSVAQRVIDLAQQQQKQVDEAVQTVDAIHERIVADRDAANASEETDRANPQCRALLETDVGAVCPGYASGVRQRANRRLP